MYYNSNKYANDYYNSYKREIQELGECKKEIKVEDITKIIFLVVILFLFILANYYLYKYFTNNIDTKQDNQLMPIIIKEELPKSPQLITYETEHTKDNTSSSTKLKQNINITPDKISTLSKKDIALIVQTIISQINTKQELSLKKELESVESTKFTKKTLKESSYYKKLREKNIKNSKLMELIDNINHILEEPNKDKI